MNRIDSRLSLTIERHKKFSRPDDRCAARFSTIYASTPNLYSANTASSVSASIMNMHAVRTFFPYAKVEGSILQRFRISLCPHDCRRRSDLGPSLRWPPDSRLFYRPPEISTCSIGSCQHRIFSSKPGSVQRSVKTRRGPGVEGTPHVNARKNGRKKVYLFGHQN